MAQQREEIQDFGVTPEVSPQAGGLQIIAPTRTGQPVGVGSINRAGLADFTGPSGGHDLKFKTPVQAVSKCMRLQARASPLERVPDVGQAGLPSLTRLSGEHDLKFNTPTPKIIS